jgi:ribose 1,5-bisphosphate isomerase
MFQGYITATNLAKAGLNVTMIVDSAASRFLHDTDLFLTGADAILNDGSVVNKIGTAQISLAANKANVPHFVATSSHCFDPLTYFGVPEQIEERPAKEVWNKAPKKIQIRNPAFDITEAKLVKGIITEKGVFSADNFALQMYEELGLKENQKEFLSLLKLMKK